MGAPWRKNRRTTWDLLRTLRANNISPSPLLNAPWVIIEIFRMDWLHCVDQGVASTLLGCIFYITIRRKEVGCNITVRTDAFWSRVQGPRLLYTSYHYVCMLHVCMVYVCCMYGISLYDTSGFYERKKVQDQITGFTYTLVKQNQKKHTSVAVQHRPEH